MSERIPPAAATVLQQTDLYRVFAYAFGLPVPERFAWLSRPDLGPSLAALWDELEWEGAAPKFTPFRSYEQYESAYIALFDVGVPEPPVPLIESAHHKAVPAQQIALDCVNFYEVLGLRHQASSFPPDHLVTQLEFLAAVRYARENAPDAAQEENLAHLERDFLERHLLNWLAGALEKLESTAPPCFPILLRFLHTFAQQQAAALGAQIAQASPTGSPDEAHIT